MHCCLQAIDDGGTLMYTQVINIPHMDRYGQATYVRLTMAGGRRLSLAEAHYTYAAASDAPHFKDRRPLAGRDVEVLPIPMLFTSAAARTTVWSLHPFFTTDRGQSDSQSHERAQALRMS